MIMDIRTRYFTSGADSYMGFYRDYWNIIKHINTLKSSTTNLKTFFDHYNPFIKAIVMRLKQIQKDSEISLSRNQPIMKYAPDIFRGHSLVPYINGRLYKQSLNII